MNKNNNITITCPICQGKYKKCNITHHYKSEKHKTIELLYTQLKKSEQQIEKMKNDIKSEILY